MRRRDLLERPGQSRGSREAPLGPVRDRCTVVPLGIDPAPLERIEHAARLARDVGAELELTAIGDSPGDFAPAIEAARASLARFQPEPEPMDQA